MPTARHPVALALLASLLAPPALAQDAPVPRMFQGMQGQKGQWQMEFLEGSGREGKGRPPAMTVCSDNLLRQQAQDKGAPKAESRCTHRLLKDTPDEAVMESTCPDGKNTVTLTREGSKSMLMSMHSSGARGERTMKMRYTHLGPCREGQGTVTLDPNSEQCQKLKARAAKMDPEKSCARRKTDREECEQRMRDTAAKLSAMCK